jgi:pyrroline-5-carboxylate reductase
MSFDDTVLSFIGAGVMAEAMINGFLNKELVSPGSIHASEPRPERCRELEERYGIHLSTDNREVARLGDVVVLSVKPQVLPAVLPELRGEIKPGALLLSIVAGAPVRRLVEGLEHRAVVRVMPNTPAQIGQGMAVWTATPQVSEHQHEQARAMLNALGEEMFFEDEGYLDMATALSGTGPAYVFLFMEALIDAGVHMGFSRWAAEKLVLQTMQGSVAFARSSLRHPAELRNMVTSPGGTSAEALYQLEKGSLRTVISKAVWAAYQKSKYLGEFGG